MRLQRKHMLSFTISVGLLLAIGAGGAVRAEEASTIETLQQPELPIGSVGGEVHADPAGVAPRPEPNAAAGVRGRRSRTLKRRAGRFDGGAGQRRAALVDHPADDRTGDLGRQGRGARQKKCRDEAEETLEPHGRSLLFGKRTKKR